MSVLRCCHIRTVLFIAVLAGAEARSVRQTSKPGFETLAEMHGRAAAKPSKALATLVLTVNPRAAFSVPSPGHQILGASRKVRDPSAVCATRVVARTWKTATMQTEVQMSGTEAPSQKATAVYALILVNLAIFLADNILRLPFFQQLYLCHAKWEWWQPLTACFCHGSRSHLSGNMFLLLLFGRSVEDNMGRGGLFFSFVFCGVVANLVSLAMLPSNVVSIGASGAVFGLFAVSILVKLSVRNFDWRNVVELAVLSEFVFGKIVSEMTTVAKGGVAGINHVAHLSGAGAGVALVLLLQLAVGKMEGDRRNLLDNKR